MYERNECLRGPGEKVEMTPNLIAEFIRCKEDILYFAQKYFFITTIDDGKIIIPLRRYQKKMLKAFFEPSDGKKHTVCVSSRQIGKCFSSDTEIKIRNKKTGEIKTLSVVDFYNLNK
jgi:hypothetical protein